MIVLMSSTGTGNLVQVFLIVFYQKVGWRSDAKSQNHTSFLSNPGEPRCQGDV